MSNLTKDQIEHHRANFEKAYPLPDCLFFNGEDYRIKPDFIDSSVGVVVCWTPPLEECQNYNIHYRAWLYAIENTPIDIPEFKSPVANLSRTIIIKALINQGFKVSV